MGPGPFIGLAGGRAKKNPGGIKHDTTTTGRRTIRSHCGKWSDGLMCVLSKKLAPDYHKMADVQLGDDRPSTADFLCDWPRE